MTQFSKEQFIEWGRKGGRTTSKRLGKKHFSKIGKKGRATIKKIADTPHFISEKGNAKQV